MRAEAHTKCLHTVCQCDFDSLDLGDVRRLLDDAAGESGSCGAALPCGRSGPCGAGLAYNSGPGGGDGGSSGAAPPCGSDGHWCAALLSAAALPLS